MSRSAPVHEKLLACTEEMVACLAPFYPGTHERLLALCQRWIATLRVNTMRSVIGDLNNWMRWQRGACREQPPLSAAALTAFAEAHGKDRSFRNLRRTFWCLRMVLNALDQLSQAEHALMVKVAIAHRMATAGDRTKPPAATPFGWNQLKQCIAAADPKSPVDTRNLAIALTMYDTMVRVQSLLGYRRGGLWYERPAASDAYRRLRDGTGGITLECGGVLRQFYLSALTVEWIERHRRQAGPTSALFVTQTGNPCPPSIWVASIQPLLKTARQTGRFGWLSLKLGAASDMLRAGMSMETVRIAGGWNSVGILMRLLSSPVEPQPNRRLAELQGRTRVRLDGSSSTGAPINALGVAYMRRNVREPGAAQTGDLFG